MDTLSARCFWLVSTHHGVKLQIWSRVTKLIYYITIKHDQYTITQFFPLKTNTLKKLFIKLILNIT